MGELPALPVELAQLGGAQGALRGPQLRPELEHLLHLVTVAAHELVEQPRARGRLAQRLDRRGQLGVSRGLGLLDPGVARRRELLGNQPVQLVRDVVDAHRPIVSASRRSRGDVRLRPG